MKRNEDIAVSSEKRAFAFNSFWRLRRVLEIPPQHSISCSSQDGCSVWRDYRPGQAYLRAVYVRRFPGLQVPHTKPAFGQGINQHAEIVADRAGPRTPLALAELELVIGLSGLEIQQHRQYEWP